jgi:hypothetical protein
MTVIADNKKRVTLPTKPGERFDVQIFAGDKFILTRLEPVQPRRAKVIIKKEDGYSVGELGHPITEADIKEALAEFP